MLVIALVLSPLATAQHPPHVELGEVLPPHGTRLANVDGLGRAASPDLDGDGADDFVLAVPDSHAGGTYAGAVYVVFGPLDEDFALDPEAAYPGRGLRLLGLQSSDQLGRSLGEAGDVNADGVEDLALATDDRAFVLFGGAHLRALATIDLAQLDPALGFELETDLPGDDNMQVYAPLGDVNADGRDDLFVGFPRKDTPWSTHPFQNDVRCATPGDVDGDLDQDLLVGEGDRDTIVVLFNAGDGTFPTRVTVVLPENRDLRLADLDGDGDLDLVAEWEKWLDSSTMQAWLAVFLNSGNGTFGARADYQLGTVGRGMDVELGDLDGDGDLDVASLCHHDSGTPTSSLSQIRTFTNDGLGHLTQRHAVTLQTHTRDLALIDFDGDADRDLVVANERMTSPAITPLLRFFANDGSGAFALTGSVSIPGFSWLVVADLTGDARDDLHVQGRLFRGSATGLQPVEPLLFPDPTVGVPYPSDFDGDGNVDLAVQHGFDGVLVRHNAGDAVFDAHVVYIYGAINGRTKAGDLDGDGAPDLVIEERDAVSIAFNRGDGTFGGHGSGGAFVVFGDPLIGASGTLDLDQLGGTGGFSIPGAEQGASVGLSASPAGDLDADGVRDLVFAAPGAAQGRGELYVLYGGPGLGAAGTLDPTALTPAEGLRIRGPTSEGCCATVLGDLDVDGDGRPDLVCGSPDVTIDGAPEAGRVFVVRGSDELVAAGTIDLAAIDGTNGFALTGVSGTYLGGSLIRAGDFDRDGRDDFAAGAAGDDTLGTNRGAVYVVYGAPAPAGGALTVEELGGRFGTGLHPSLGSFFGSRIESGDWNDDGRVDLYLPSVPYFTGSPDARSVHLLWSLPKTRRRGL